MKNIKGNSIQFQIQFRFQSFFHSFFFWFAIEKLKK